MNKRLTIECIKIHEDINFTEELEGESTIGYIDDNDRHIKVLYLEDNLGKYLSLVYAIEKKENYEEVMNRLSRWIINGRYELLGNQIILCSILPILDENLLKKQIIHAISEIWDMNNIARNTPE